MNVIEVAGVSKRFGEHTVLDGLDFCVERGEVYGLLGPNGCGKSTTISLLCNLLAADGGSVRMAGQAVSRDTQRHVGLCPQDIALYPDLLPVEILSFYTQVYGLSRAAGRRRVAELMQLFGLEPYAGVRVHSLSGGWKQRLNMACSLVHQPEVLILDEPTSAVDVQARHSLWTLIEGLRDGGMTILLTTHHLDEAARLCTRIGIMLAGRVAHEGTVAQLCARVPAQAVATVHARDDAAVEARAAALGWVPRRYAAEPTYLLPQTLTLTDMLRQLDGLGVTSASVQPVSLEHAYLEVLASAA